VPVPITGQRGALGAHSIQIRHGRSAAGVIAQGIHYHDHHLVSQGLTRLSGWEWRRERWRVLHHRIPAMHENGHGAELGEEKQRGGNDEQQNELLDHAVCLPWKLPRSLQSVQAIRLPVVAEVHARPHQPGRPGDILHHAERTLLPTRLSIRCSGSAPASGFTGEASIAILSASRRDALRLYSFTQRSISRV
jgi:hypothetical protein